MKCYVHGLLKQQDINIIVYEIWVNMPEWNEDLLGFSLSKGQVEKFGPTILSESEEDQCGITKNSHLRSGIFVQLWILEAQAT